MESTSRLNMQENSPTINIDVVSVLHNLSVAYLRSFTYAFQSEIPLFQRPLGVTGLGSSLWASAYRVDSKNDAGEDESYFMKVSIGEQGRAALYGEFESTSKIHSVVRDFIPKPILWGSFKEIQNAHYYICKFYNLRPDLPEKFEFCAKVAELHSKSQSPNGKFGFHVITYNGNLPQENGYADTWEECFVNDKVIPRLLRPMESGGRFIKPSLVHGDLWCGNAAVNSETGCQLVYDPSSFYAHNEYELGNWRPGRNKFDTSYFLAYESNMKKSEPMDDFDDRNALYSIRFNLHAPALFPGELSYRELVIDEMKRLIAKYPNGYEEGEGLSATSTAQALPTSFNVNDISIPAVGFGTFQGDDRNGQVKEAVLNALRTGYRHIDTALAYGNEKEIGEAIKESGIPRKEIFVTTKLAQTWHNPSDVEEALDQSLKTLQLDYDTKPVIDLELSREYPQTWQAMEKLVDSGKTRLIGVSNFSIVKTKRILEIARIRPAVNQVLRYFPQQELLDFCFAEGIHVTAHQPLGGRPVAAVGPNSDRPGPLLDPTRGVFVVPKTVQENRMVENRALSRLTDEDMTKIYEIVESTGAVRYLDPKGHIGFDIFTESVDEPVAAAE
ncbi:hypothetical protein V499_00079 [Pseudogymnoascus sp. VKM F-103]|nr:hypothetical protein V499_00079 [Pseudogymnoascus sp. VKM F-103]